MIAFLLIGLGVAVVVEWIKALVPWPLQSVTKIALVLVFCVAAAYFLTSGWEQGTLTVLGALGISQLTHRTSRFLTAAGDDHRLSVIQNKRLTGRSRRER